MTFVYCSVILNQNQNQSTNALQCRTASLSDNTWMLLRCPDSPRLSWRRPRLFLCVPAVFGLPAHHCAYLPQTQALRFDLLPNQRLQQQRPMSHFVVSGNRWTSHKPSGVFVYFSSPCWEVEGLKGDYSADGRSGFRCVQIWDRCEWLHIMRSA